MSIADKLRYVESSLEEIVKSSGQQLPDRGDFMITNISDHAGYIAKLVGMIKGGLGGMTDLPIHICTEDEYDAETGIPTVTDPVPDTFYLVPSGSDLDDMFEEWVYVNDRWERFGTGVGATMGELDDAPTAGSQNAVKSAGIKSALDKKTNRTEIGQNGTALMFNENDGGGAKFEHKDGTMSFVGVNDGGENGISGQIYSVKKVDGKNVGTRLNITSDGFYYLPNSDFAGGYTADDELATKKDIVEGIINVFNDPESIYIFDSGSIDGE